MSSLVQRVLKYIYTENYSNIGDKVDSDVYTINTTLLVYLIICLAVNTFSYFK